MKKFVYTFLILCTLGCSNSAIRFEIYNNLANPIEKLVISNGSDSVSIEGFEPTQNVILNLDFDKKGTLKGDNVFQLKFNDDTSQRIKTFGYFTNGIKPFDYMKIEITKDSIHFFRK